MKALQLLPVLLCCSSASLSYFFSSVLHCQRGLTSRQARVGRGPNNPRLAPREARRRPRGGGPAVSSSPSGSPNLPS